MALSGSVPVTGFIAPTAVGDTYATHQAIYGKGGLRTVANNTVRDAIPVSRREEGMEVYSVASATKYRLEADLTTWTVASTGILPSDVMTKTVYDPNDDGIVTNSNQLNSQPASYYLDRANHTGTQAQATITNLTTDLGNKQNTSEKGQANGYVPLNGSTLIDGAFLPPFGQTPLEGWNANTNTPTLADGTGSAGEYTFVTVNGSQNLGSGVLNCVVGNFLYHDGTKWNLVPISGFGVSSWNGLSGAVTADTSDVPEATDLNYVTDDESDALGAANSPSLTNPFTTQNDLTGALTVGNSILMPETFANGETLGDGTLRTLTSLGYTNGSAAAAWPLVDANFTIDVNTMSIDWITWQEACLTMEAAQASILTPGGRGYCFNQTVLMPDDQLANNFYRRSYQFVFDFNGSVFYNRTGNNIIMFQRYPANQAATGGGYTDYSFIFRNARAVGNDSANITDCFIKLGATTHSKFTDIWTYDFGCPINAEFCLEMMMDNIKHQSYGLYGSKIGNGTWSGATSTNAQSNIVTIANHRCVNGTGKTPTAGIYLTGNEMNYLYQPSFEGVNGAAHHILYDNLNSIPKQCVRIFNLYIEEAGTTRAAVRHRGNAGMTVIDGYSVVQSTPVNAVLIEADRTGAPLYQPIYIKVMNSPQGNSGTKFREINGASKWVVEDVDLNDNGTFTATANWDTSLAGSTIATLYRYTQRL